MVKLFDPDQYHQRNKVETVFSVLKRKFKEAFRARKYRLYVKEINMNVILYNLSGLMKSFSVLIIVKEFSRASNRILNVTKKALQPKKKVCVIRSFCTVWPLHRRSRWRRLC
jgi:hypothetical protein